MGRRGPVQNFVIFTMAINTRNKKIIMKAKKHRRESEIIQEKGERLNILSLALKWEGIRKERVEKAPKRVAVRKT